jgi:hypothetical protein
MVDTIRRVPTRAAGWAALAFYALALLVQVLVLATVIPVSWVGGGRIPSLADYAPMSVANIAVYLLAGPFAAFASGITGARRAPWHRAVAWALVALWTAGLGMNSIGAPFERMVLAPLLLIGVLAHLRIAIGQPDDHAGDPGDPSGQAAPG